MKLKIILRMLFELLQKRKLSAAYFSKKYNLSARTVYRYIEALKTAVPLEITRGRNGGIVLPDNFRLPMNFMTNEEYLAAMDGLEIAYCHQPEQRFLLAREKLASEYKPTEEELLEQAEDDDPDAVLLPLL
jgi:predicted DNA-binding transcriptional regulator YafY